MEKYYSTLSFNWKEENLLRKKLSCLESMKKHEANAWLMEQKTFYKRCYSELQRSELAHARLLGNKELVKQLTSKSMFSNYCTILEDESEAAVKAIIKNRRRSENNMIFQSCLDKERHCPARRNGLIKKAEAQEVPRVTLKANSKEEDPKATMKRTFSVRQESKSAALVLSLESLKSPEQGAQQRKLPMEKSLPLQGEEGILSNFSRHLNIVLSDPIDPVTDRESKGKLLKYTVHENRNVEHPQKKRPMNNLYGPEDVQIDAAVLTEIQAMLGQNYLLNETTNLVDRVTSPPHPAYFLFSDSLSKSPSKKVSEGALNAPGIRSYAAGRRQKIVLEETGSNSITTKNGHLFS